jgi:hypothetical protein
MNAKPVEKYVNAGAKGEGGGIRPLPRADGKRHVPHHGLQQALPAASGSTDRETEAA